MLKRFFLFLGLPVCSLACLQSQTVAFWHFEGDKGFLGDSGSHDLAFNPEGTRKGSITSHQLPREGAGSGFANKNNRIAANFGGQQGGLEVPASPLLNLPSFTVEAFINLAADPRNKQASVIIDHGAGSRSGGAWTLSVTNPDSVREVRHLSFQQQFKEGPWAGDTVVSIDSGIELETNVDYYVAVTFNAETTGPEGLVFYVRDLRDGSLQIVEKQRPPNAARVPDSTGNVTVGERWSGLIDEVRISDRQLNEDELPALRAPLPLRGKP